MECVTSSRTSKTKQQAWAEFLSSQGIQFSIETHRELPGVRLYFNDAMQDSTVVIKFDSAGNYLGIEGQD